MAEMVPVGSPSSRPNVLHRQLSAKSSGSRAASSPVCAKVMISTVRRPRRMALMIYSPPENSFAKGSSMAEPQNSSPAGAVPGSEYPDTCGVPPDLLQLLVCPMAHAELRLEEGHLVCTRCGPRFPIS